MLLYNVRVKDTAITPVSLNRKLRLCNRNVNHNPSIYVSCLGLESNSEPTHWQSRTLPLRQQGAQHILPYEFFLLHLSCTVISNFDMRH